MLHLTESELAEITGRVRSAAQSRALSAMGIPFKVNPDGKILVVREHYISPKTAAYEPDFEALA